MKKMLSLGCGSALAIATGVYLFFWRQPKIKFQRVKVLEKESLIYLFKQIRSDYTEKFSTTLRLNRKKRRSMKRGGREYRVLIKELKEQAKEHIQKSVEDVLAKNKITEEILSESYRVYENDPEVRSAISKICSIETNKTSSVINRKIEEILEFYISRVEELSETDPNELNIKMKIIEDDIYDEFGCDPEEIEACATKNHKKVEDLVRVIKEINDNLLQKTNQELFF
jgi:hypothetical protein